jgi:hypothetical protein
MSKNQETDSEAPGVKTCVAHRAKFIRRHSENDHRDLIFKAAELLFLAFWQCIGIRYTIKRLRNQLVP